MSPEDQFSGFLTSNREDLIRIGVGVADIAMGISLTGTAAGAPPGLLLIAVGADQVFTGINNILTGQKNRSLFEEGGYRLTLWMGFSEETAGIVGQLTLGLLSLGAGIWGGFATSSARAGGGVGQVGVGRTGRSLTDAPRPLPGVLPDHVRFFTPGDSVYQYLRNTVRLPEDFNGVWVLRDRLIYINREVWDGARIAQRSRIFWEEQGHYLRDMARTTSQQARAQFSYNRRGLFTAWEEYNASRYSWITRGQAFDYSRNYLSRKGVLLDLWDIGWRSTAIPIGLPLGYIIYRNW